MSLPLYKNHCAPSALPAGAHTGLWFDKFCHQWCLDSSKSGLVAWSLKSFTVGQGQDKKEVNPKLDWIRTATKGRIGDEKILAEHSQRLAQLTRSSSGSALFFKTAGPFAPGLGREHPIENGLAWHPTLGTPYLPGSSIKGLVRAWAATWESAAKADVTRIFGPRGGREANTGTVIFLDALPTKPVQLAADVMTPHYGPYYQDKTGQTAPGDWHSPVPIPFLTVAVGQSFLFALAPRNPSDKADCEQAALWLETALRELGAGAKTAVGYGRFERDTAAEAETQKAAEAAARAFHEAQENAAFTASLNDYSPLARELMQAAKEQNWAADGNAFKANGVIENWLTRLETDPQPDAIKQLRMLFDVHLPGLLLNPDKPKKNGQPFFGSRQPKLAKRLIAITKQ